MRLWGNWGASCVAAYQTQNQKPKATQLARQVQQERTQVVCSNKVARKRLTESNGTPAMDLGHMNVVLE